ncbi:hypothetical protein CRENBAI_019933 [Crenichthys baileyi]|uniref:Uncharacterized protein n=1 Tax=Crenichthys baileyi TaxID=28760 RepID=A0AAV9QYJ6_9TELE
MCSIQSGGATPKLDHYFKNPSCPGQTMLDRPITLLDHQDSAAATNCSRWYFPLLQCDSELCYLCMQQFLRNVPDYQRKQQARQTEHREHAKQMAAFNLKVSKREKSACSDCPGSFLFPARPITPPKRIKQHRYMNDLPSQMKRRQKLQAQNQQYRLLTEHLNQIQLTQE